MILEEEVIIKINSANFKRYEELGYTLPKYINSKGELVVKQGEKVKVKVKDLSNGSKVLVTKICDECGYKMPNQIYAHVLINRKRSDGKDRCRKCARIKGENTKNENIDSENSLASYAEKNNKEFLLLEFSDKNEKKPSEIKFGSNHKYIWICQNCKSEYTATVNNRINGRNCSYCSGKKVNEFNSLWCINPEVAKLLTNPDEGHLYTSGSGEKILFTCPTCKNVGRKTIKTVVKVGLGCTKCGDGLSYPEKFVIQLLNQLHIEFESQKRFDWSFNKRYDFYIPQKNCIIETHGIQHYSNHATFHKLSGKTLEDEQLNDELKKELANRNGIKHYVTIDCSKSDMDFIRKNIADSVLNDLFGLSQIDWKICHEFAYNSLVKTVCDLWNTTELTTVSIGKSLGLHQTTILRYIKQGVKLGWCEYDSTDSYKRIYKTKSVWNKTKIVQLTINDEFLKCWDSLTEAANELKLNHTGISNVCRGKLKTSGGFKWKYLRDYENEI
ncbi:hypothetical protein D1B33_04765 [Lysinibacillus yapensis]|uniref:Treble clef zinc finger domain-containing protein n=1 Tax=Ureibacillus yapensis TaxID=2304605 RepID=A0A396SA51_9BACL|nr:zinc-ribbon domain-containing protein [Lysinibacillus yapensis]RHW38204.1 hypothetical protein D1B33_04765 [Lysinibacillus yapensis]